MIYFKEEILEENILGDRQTKTQRGRPVGFGSRKGTVGGRGHGRRDFEVV